jgi:hypothetical protein
LAQALRKRTTRMMPASVKAAPTAASNVAGEPVAGSCAGAAPGATAATMDAGRTWAGWRPGSLGTGGKIEARGAVDEDDELEAGTLDDDELVDDELGGTLDDELLELDGGTLDDDELLDDELLDELLDDELLDEELLDELLDEDPSVLTIEVLDVCVGVADAGPLSTAMSPSTSPAPSTTHPAFALRSIPPLRPRCLEPASRNVRRRCVNCGTNGTARGEMGQIAHFPSAFEQRDGAQAALQVVLHGPDGQYLHLVGGR